MVAKVGPRLRPDIIWLRRMHTHPGIVVAGREETCAAFELPAVMRLLIYGAAELPRICCGLEVGVGWVKLWFSIAITKTVLIWGRTWAMTGLAPINWINKRAQKTARLAQRSWLGRQASVLIGQ